MSEYVRPIVHSTAELRGSAANDEDEDDNDGHDSSLSSPFIVSPSLLACDWANIQKEVDRCKRACLPWIHGEQRVRSLQ